MKKEDTASNKLFSNRSFLFQSIVLLIIILILITSALTIGNYIPKLESWIVKILKSPTFSNDQKLQFVSFELFGLSFIGFLLLSRWIINARREALYLAEKEKAHAKEVEKLNQELDETIKQLAKANQDLHLANEQLGERNKLLTEIDALRLNIIGAMQHDLNHVLSLIQGGTESLITFWQQEDLSSEDDYVKEEIPKILMNMKDASRQLANLSKDAFDQAKSKMGEKITINKGEFDFLKLIEAGLRWKSSIIKSKNIEIEVQSPKELKIEADQIRLFRVLTNIIDNAAKYSRANGKIIIKLQITDENQLLCKIIDNGIGIPKNYLEEIFKLHVRVKSELADQIAGTERHGIGLSPCKGVIEAHGGSIWAESEGEGKGSCFSFTIPVK
ncbi:HAMP domain-containing histidine kinase [bacterium]|nr:HAMP domain-containing histidine kinase [bacterium]